MPPALPRARAVLIVVCALVIGSAALYRLHLGRVAAFAGDEGQHLHAAWCLAQGQLPYRDYFEHHPPLFHGVLALALQAFQVEGSAPSTARFILFARLGSWLGTALSLGLLLLLGALWRGWRVGLVAAVVLSLSIIAFEKAIEIRPEPWAIALWLGSLAACLAALRRDPARALARRKLFLLGGVLLGLALLTTQKLLLAGPGLALAAGWYLLDPRLAPGRGERARELGLLTLGVAAPWLLTAALFAAQDAGALFWERTLGGNAAWPFRFGPFGFIRKQLRQNPVDTTLGLLGLGATLATMARARGLRRGDALLALPTAALIAGLWIIPVPYRQYYALFLPLLALFAAASVVVFLGRWCAGVRRRPDLARRLLGRALAAGLAGLLLLGLFRASLLAKLGEELLERWSPGLLALWTLAGLGALLLPFLGARRDAILAGLLLVLAVHPVLQVAPYAGTRGMEESLREVEAVHARSQPGEIVLDGWPMRAWFRPHAFFHPFLHHEMPTVLSGEDKAAMVEALRSGAVVPRLVLLDRFVRAVDPRLSAYLEAHYRPTGVGRVWERVR